MAIQLTESAANQVKRALTKRAGAVALRMGVKKVGCSGLAYTFDYADVIGEDDRVFESFDTRVVVNAQSLPYLDGSTVDFRREGFNEAFKVDNPNVDSSCGCGESFNVKPQAVSGSNA
jgi:iron-sulfur cluster assembly protein